MNKQKELRKIIPPKIEWVTEYCNERKNDITPQRFFDHYEMVGWKVGRNKMVDWQAAVRTWENRSGYQKPEANQQQSQRRQKPEVAL